MVILRVNTYTCVIPGLIVMTTGVLLASFNQLLFIGLAQMFLAVIGFLVYFLAVHTHNYSRDNMLVFLGRAYIVVALISLIQLFGHSNLAILGYGENWTLPAGGRIVEAMALLAAPLFVRCHSYSKTMQVGSLVLGLLMVLAISGLGLPLTLIPDGVNLGKSSLTEYLILILLLLAVPHFRNCAQLEEHPAYYLLTVMVGVMAMGEIIYLLGDGLSEFRVVALYLFRLLAHYLLLFALVNRGIREPYERLHQAYEETLDGWGQALEMRDWETVGHCRRVAELTVKVARRCGIRGEKLVNMYRGALLHDIGKLAVPDQVLLKVGELTAEEWDIMRCHPVYAVRLLGKIAFLQSAIDIPLYHHEKWDGSGYPHGLSGEAIPLAARIFALVDVWDALSHDRPYRQAWDAERIFNWMKDQIGSHFDPILTQVFIGFMQEQKLINR